MSRPAPRARSVSSSIPLAVALISGPALTSAAHICVGDAALVAPGFTPPVADSRFCRLGRSPRRAHVAQKAFASLPSPTPPLPIGAPAGGTPRLDVGCATRTVCICTRRLVGPRGFALLSAIGRAGRRGVARGELRGPQAAPSLAPIHSAAPSPQSRRRLLLADVADRSSAIAQAEEPGGPPARLLRHERDHRAAGRGVIATDGNQSRDVDPIYDRFYLPSGVDGGHRFGDRATLGASGCLLIGG